MESLSAKLILTLLILSSPRVTFAICEHENRRYENLKRDAVNWGRASIITMGAGSFFGPLGSLVGAGPGAVSYRYRQMADQAWKDYRFCIERVEREAKDRLEKARRAEEQRLEEERRKEKGKLNDVDI